MSRPLRILQVAHGFPPDEQAGAELCCYYLSRELSRRGHHVQVFTRTARAEVRDFELLRETADGFAVARLKLPTDTAGSLEDTYRSDFVRRRFEDELKTGFDVVHIHHLLGLSTDLVSAARNAGARVVLTLHDFWYLCPRGQRFTPWGHLCTEVEPWRCSPCIAKKRARYALNALGHVERFPDDEHRWSRSLRNPLAALVRGARYVTANLHRRPILERTSFILRELNLAELCLAPSRFLLEEYRRYGLDSRCEFLENGVEVDWVGRLAPREGPHDPLRFGFLGSFLPSKGVDLLVEAFQEMPGPSELHLHGTSLWDGGRMFDRLRERNRNPRVFFHGPFVHEHLPEVLGDLDVLVVPSRWFENAPLTLDEAALSRIPVIAAGHGGMKEVVERRGNGLLFAPGDREDLLRTLLRFAGNPALWHSLRTPKVPVCTIAEQVSALERRYQELLGESPSAS